MLSGGGIGRFVFFDNRFFHDFFCHGSCFDRRLIAKQVGKWIFVCDGFFHGWLSDHVFDHFFHHRRFFRHGFFTEQVGKRVFLRNRLFGHRGFDHVFNDFFGHGDFFSQEGLAEQVGKWVFHCGGFFRDWFSNHVFDDFCHRFLCGRSQQIGKRVIGRRRGGKWVCNVGGGFNHLFHGSRGFFHYRFRGVQQIRKRIGNSGFFGSRRGFCGSRGGNDLVIAKAGEEGIQIILGNGRDGQGQRAQQGGQPTYHRMTPCLSGRGVPYPNQAGRCNGFMRSFSAKPAGLYTP